jgi:hypothetical protein
MPYVFPKRSLKDGDVLDPQELNEDFIAAADLYSGRLDQHNFDATLSPTVSKNAFYDTKYAYKEVEIDWGGATTSFATKPYDTDDIATGFGAKVIPNDGSWDTVTFTSGDYDSNNLLTVTSGTSIYWINAQLQYFWRGWLTSGQHQFSKSAGAIKSKPARVQFALRINGNIIDSTITGKELPYDRAVKCIKTTTQRTISVIGGAAPNPLPGPQQEYCYDTSTPGPEIFPIRITAVVPMPAGTNTVEIVCRRLAITDSIDPYAFDATGGNDNNVYVTNRQLSVTVLPTYATATTTFDSVSVEGFEAEDTFSSAAIGAERIDTIRDKYNAVKAGALARGSLNHLQLPSMIGSATQQVHIFRTAPPYAFESQNLYPGWTDPGTGATVTTSTSGTGWRLITDTTGTFASPSGGVLRTGAFTVSEASYLIVFASLGLRSLPKRVIDLNSADPASGIQQFIQTPGGWCAFRIGVLVNGGSVTTLPYTEAAVNRFNLAGDATFTGTNPASNANAESLAEELKQDSHENTNIPLFAVIDVDTGGDYAVGTSFDYIGVYGAAMAPVTGTAGYTIQNSNIEMIQIKKGS